jgi:hypothetical protein
MDWRHMRELLAASRAVFAEFKNLCVWNNAGVSAKSHAGHAAGAAEVTQIADASGAILSAKELQDCDGSALRLATNSFVIDPYARNLKYDPLTVFAYFPIALASPLRVV